MANEWEGSPRPRRKRGKWHGVVVFAVVVLLATAVTVAVGLPESAAEFVACTLTCQWAACQLRKAKAEGS